MGRVTFDTLTYTKILREAGFSETQAEGLAKAQSGAFDQMIDNSDLATKGDIARLDNHIVRLEKQMGETELRLIAMINEVQINLLKWIFSFLVGFGALLVAAMAWLMPR